MNKDRLEECRRWAELTDKNVHIAGVRLPAGMATELVAEVERLKAKEPVEITFKDIQLGDTIRVTFPPRGGMSDNWELTHSREGMAYYLSNPDTGYASWITADHQNLVSRDHYGQADIELLKRFDFEKEETE